jgi:hypothetical protein
MSAPSVQGPGEKGSRMTPYQRIMRAAKLGKGIRLSAGEAFYLSLDDAIMTRAQLDDDPESGR